MNSIVDEKKSFYLTYILLIVTNNPAIGKIVVDNVNIYRPRAI